MTRIVAGSLGGRRLVAPAGRDTRPTSERVREGLFNALSTRTDLVGSHFADLYAGSGAAGLEAISRGAASALLVESDQRAVRAIRNNVATLGVGAAVTIVVDRVERLLARSPDRKLGVVFADPPYSVPDEAVDTMLTSLVLGGWLAEEAVVVVERSSRTADLTWVVGITPDGSRRYGETTLWYGRRS